MDSSLSLNDVDSSPNSNKSKTFSVNEIPLSITDKFMFLGEVSDGIFPVYKVGTFSSDETFALKCFKKSEPQAVTSFKNELRFSYLQHPNIIKLQHFESGKELCIGGVNIKADYILMDYCPYGNFYELMYEKEVYFSEVVLRTYFHQLVSVLEYLHTQKVAHMDIKLENLLLGPNYELKLCDFDSACFAYEPGYGLGTFYYRAPEVIEERCTDYLAADIYSAGVLLFVLKTGGSFPHYENELLDDGTCLFDLLYHDTETFWKVHTEICETDESFFDEDFRELFIAMTEYDPQKRINTFKLKASKWFNKEVLSKDKLGKRMFESRD